MLWQVVGAVFLVGSTLAQAGAQADPAEARLAEDPPAGMKPQPIPAIQILPLPYDQVSVELSNRDRRRGAAAPAGQEITRYHFGQQLRRPFLYPLSFPSSASLTRMGHPHDANGHSHHNSLWISHHDVNGVGFWNDQSKGLIQHKRVSRFEDANDLALIEVENQWVDEAGKKIMDETRAMRFLRRQHPSEWILIIDLDLKPGADAKEGVTFGKTPFGIVGIRMAKTIGVHDGGGRILNSEGAINEPEVHWKPARWVDYSGPWGAGFAGITLFNHPQNPSHPTHFHVRDDGWMGACLNYEDALKIEPGKSLKLRYGFWIHSGAPDKTAIDRAGDEFLKVGDVPAKIKK
jgi:hypothetical protein